jgi:YesN/AraC family two-component response regulator
MNRAKELLEFYNHNLPDIARLVGYKDEFYFSRLFKKTIGVPPSHYSKHLGQDQQ